MRLVTLAHGESATAAVLGDGGASPVGNAAPSPTPGHCCERARMGSRQPRRRSPRAASRRTSPRRSVARS